MDLSTYDKVLQLRGIDPNRQNQNDHKGMTFKKVGMRMDLANGKVCWTGKWFKDWQNYQKCMHPLFSIFLAPSIHPFSRRERLVVLFCTISVNAAITALVGAIARNNSTVGTITSVCFGLVLALITNILKVCPCVVHVYVIYICLWFHTYTCTCII